MKTNNNDLNELQQELLKSNIKLLPKVRFFSPQAKVRQDLLSKNDCSNSFIRPVANLLFKRKKICKKFLKRMSENEEKQEDSRIKVFNRGKIITIDSSLSYL